MLSGIEFVEQIFKQTLELEHRKEPAKYFGGQNQIEIISFYEQLNTQHDVDRFTEVYQDLMNEQNKAELIGDGVLLAPENPSYINVNDSLIIPLTWTLQMRTTLGNRDKMIQTLNNLNSILRGRKVDIAELDNGQLFMVGTPFVNSGKPRFKSGDYVGDIGASTLPTFMNNLYQNVVNGHFINWFSNKDYFYYSIYGVLYLGQYDTDETDQYIAVVEETTETLPIPPEHSEFERYKVSFSFDAIRVDEPRVLNAEEYCTITLGGSATVVSGGVALGNDISKISIKKWVIQAQTDIDLHTSYPNMVYFLEPLEIPSGLGIAGEISQLTSNNFLQNKHNNGISAQINYSFVLDRNKPFLNQLYQYARFGIVGTDVYSISPNMIFKVVEYSASWGNYNVNEYYAKLTENVDIENTESDALTIAIQFEVQKLEN